MMRWTGSRQNWLIAVTLTNYVTYSCWTLINKYQFASLGTNCPVFSTAIQMLIAGGIAIVVSIAAHGRVLSLSSYSSSSSSSSSSAMERRVASPVAAAEDSAAALLMASSPSQQQPRSPRTFGSILTTQILPLGLARSIDIGCGNAALFLVSVALQQILKSLLPLFVCLLSLVVLRKNSSCYVWLSLMPIVTGSGLAAYRGEDGSANSSSSSRDSQASSTLMFGIVLALISTFGRSLKAVLNSKLLAGSASALPLRPLEVLSLEAPTSGIILLIVSLTASVVHQAVGDDESTGESLRAVHHPTVGEVCGISGGQYVWINFIAGGLMFVNQLSYISVIKFSSALSCQVLMNIKMLLLIVVSILLFHTPVSGVNVLGMLLALLGCFMYAMASHWESLADQKKKLDAFEMDSPANDNVRPVPSSSSSSSFTTTVVIV